MSAIKPTRYPQPSEMKPGYRRYSQWVVRSDNPQKVGQLVSELPDGTGGHGNLLPFDAFSLRNDRSHQIKGLLFGLECVGRPTADQSPPRPALGNPCCQ